MSLESVGGKFTVTLGSLGDHIQIQSFYRSVPVPYQKAASNCKTFSTVLILLAQIQSEFTSNTLDPSRFCFFHDNADSTGHRGGSSFDDAHTHRCDLSSMIDYVGKKISAQSILDMNRLPTDRPVVVAPPRITPRVAPRVEELRVEPRVEPREEPRVVEPRVAPRVEPRVVESTDELVERHLSILRIGAAGHQADIELQEYPPHLDSEGGLEAIEVQELPPQRDRGSPIPRVGL